MEVQDEEVQQNMMTDTEMITYDSKIKIHCCM